MSLAHCWEKFHVHHSTFSLDEEEEQEVATSISVFKYGTGQERNASMCKSSRDRLASTSCKVSPACSVDEAYDFIDKIIESHKKLRADMSGQTALFNETLVHQLGSTLADNMEWQTAQLNAMLGHHLSLIDKVLMKQGDSFIALMKYLKDTCKRSSRSWDSSEASECARRHSPAWEAVKQDNVWSEQALGKQKSSLPNEPAQFRSVHNEQSTEEIPHYSRDDRQIERDLLKLVGPTDLDALIVLHCNETMRCTLNGEVKFQSQRQGLGEDPSVYQAKIDQYLKLSLLIDLNSGMPASTLFEAMNPYKKETHFEAAADQEVKEIIPQQWPSLSFGLEMPKGPSSRGGSHSSNDSPTPVKPNWMSAV